MPSLKLLLFLLLPIFTFAMKFGNDFEDSFFEIDIDRDHPDNLYKEFEDFITKYKRNYKDEIEKKFRFAQFVRTHNKVQELNKKVQKLGHDTKYGINKFSDRTRDEMNSMYTKFPPQNNTNIPIFDLKNLRVKRQMNELPLNFSLQTQKIKGRYLLGEVKNQATCACCWAFAATALAESAYSVHMNKKIILSDQEVCDCAAKHGPGCFGGQPADGLEYIREAGLASVEEYPYVVNRSQVLGRCDAHKYDRELNPLTLEYYQISSSSAEYLITRHLYYYKIPVAVAFQIGDDFKDYEKGVIESEGCYEKQDTHWHSGVIIGFAQTVKSNGKKIDYWIFKNSWDTDWGDKGYAHIVRRKNWCNIESQVLGAKVPD